LTKLVTDSLKVESFLRNSVVLVLSFFSEMDESENETELLQTERAERLVVVDDVAILDENWPGVKAVLDNSHDGKPCCEDGICNAKETVIENNQSMESYTFAADGLSLDGTNCSPYPAEDSSFVAEVLSPSAANGNESIAIECTEATDEQDTSSFLVIDSPEEATADTAEKQDLPFVSGNESDHVTSVMASSTELADVPDLQTSVVEANLSVSDCDNELTEAAESSVTGLSQPESTAKGY